MFGYQTVTRLTNNMLSIRRHHHSMAVAQQQSGQLVDEAARHRATMATMSEEKKEALYKYELNSLAPNSVRSYESDHKVFVR